MLNYAIAAHKLIDKNPVRIIADTKSGYRENRRRNYIKPHQLKAWYDAVNNLPNRIYRDYLLLVLFTGLRRREAASLKWSQIDFVAKTLSITDTKNGDPLTLPLSDFLYGLLQERKKLTGDKPYVFPSYGKNGYLSEPKKGVSAVCEATGLDFVVHDLRRTFITVAESLDISKYALSALLNHRASDITGSYIIMDVERLRKPVDAIAAYMQEQMSGQEGDNTAEADVEGG
jgi:integrase